MFCRAAETTEQTFPFLEHPEEEEGKLPVRPSADNLVASCTTNRAGAIESRHSPLGRGKRGEATLQPRPVTGHYGRHSDNRVTTIENRLRLSQKPSEVIRGRKSG